MSSRIIGGVAVGRWRRDWREERAVTTRSVGIAGGVLAAVFVGLQFVGPARINPPTDPSLRLEAQGPVPEPVAATLRRACYDCHSHETTWPWYSRVAPPAWLVAHDVNEGRDHLNFSRWGEYNPFDRADMLEDACKEAKAGKMPLRPYLLMHPDARLSPQDVDALCAWTSGESARLTGGAGAQ
jgi:hypothetical protein